MIPLYSLFKNAYGGLSRATWLLSFTMLINRAGSMVVPFLAIYLKEGLGFSLQKTGLVLTFFGLGSMAGAFLGGWLTDKIGQFRVQIISLISGGLLFFLVANIKSYEMLLIGFFVLSTFVDAVRPANTAAIALYSKPEDVTRSFSLNRMAINFGFSVGPLAGGFLASISFFWLFIADGTTSILAGLLIYFFFRNHKVQSAVIQDKIIDRRKSGWHDGKYLLFCLCVVLFAVVFFQLFSALPIYYRDHYKLSQGMIGLLIGLNGLIVFLFEMVLVYLIRPKFALWKLMAFGTLLSGFALVILNLGSGMWIIILSMIFLSFGEIFAMPFMATFSVERAGQNNKGSYLGLYSLCYSFAFVLSPLFSTRIIEGFGYGVLWWSCGILVLIAAAGIYFTGREVRN